MKIAILNSYERLSPRVALEVDTLARLNNSIVVIGWSRNADKTKELPQELNGFQVRWITVQASRGSLSIFYTLLSLYREAWKAIKEIKCDVIHCTHLLLLPVAVFAAKKKKCKIVYDAYERYAVDFADYYVPFFKSQFRSLIESVENFFVRRVDGILTIPTVDEILAHRYKRLCRNVEVICNVPFSTFRIDDALLRRLSFKYKDRLLMTYVGGLTEDKGLFRMVDVLNLVKDKFPKVLLLLIGNFDSPQLEKDFLAYVENKGLKPYVELIPYLPYNDMLHYLRVSCIGLALHQPMERFNLVAKGSGRKFFTYMQVGLPIISTNMGEVASVIKEEQCGILVDTTSAQAVADAVVYLFNNEKIAKKMSANGSKAIAERYNWEIESKKLLQVYERLSSNT